MIAQYLVAYTYIPFLSVSTTV